MEFGHFSSEGYGEEAYDRYEEREDVDPTLSELLDIASGRTEVPESRIGGIVDIGEYAYDILCDTRMFRGSEAACELAECLVKELRNGSKHIGTDEVRDAAVTFLEENGQAPEE